MDKKTEAVLADGAKKAEDLGIRVTSLQLAVQLYESRNEDSTTVVRAASNFARYLKTGEVPR